MKRPTITKKKKSKARKRQKKSFFLLFPALFLLFLFYILFQNKFDLKSNLLTSSSTIPVIDISKWEGEIDWQKVRNSGIHHAILKIGSGDHNGEGFKEDSLFETNYKNAVEHGISCGVYFFSYAVTAEEAKREAFFCLDLLDKYDLTSRDLFFPVAFDMEYDKALQTGRRNCTNMTLAFCETIKEAGYEPMIYSSASYLEDKLIYREIKDYKLWVAHYEAVGPDFGKPYVMWQYSENGQVDGVNDLCDMNYWYTNYIEVQDLKIATDSLKLKKGHTKTLDVTIVPFNATNKRLTFKSSNEKVVKIVNDQTGSVKAVGTGNAWITVQTPSGIKERIRIKVQ